jgi:hypothetical protein
VIEIARGINFPQDGRKSIISLLLGSSRSWRVGHIMAPSFSFRAFSSFRFWISESTMNEQEFKERTKRVALRVVRLVEALPLTKTAGIIGRQLLRSGTSVGVDHRAACRGGSPADVIAKLEIVEDGADETVENRRSETRSPSIYIQKRGSFSVFAFPKSADHEGGGGITL